MIYIDVQMPANCYDCWIRQNMGCRIANDSGWLNDRRDNNCPLKAQEPVEPVYELGITRCGQCNHEIDKYGGDNYCPQCGKAVKWNG